MTTLFLKDEIDALECFQSNEGCSNLLFVDLEEIQPKSTDDPELSPCLPIHCENEDLEMLQLFNEEDENFMDNGHQANTDKPVEMEFNDLLEVPETMQDSAHQEGEEVDGKMGQENHGSEMDGESESSEVNSARPLLSLCSPPAKNSSKSKKPLYDCGATDYEERKNNDETKEEFKQRIKKAKRNRDYRVRHKLYCQNCVNMQEINQPVFELILKLGKIKSRKGREQKLKGYLKSLHK